MKEEIKEILKILKKCEFGACITKHNSRVLLDYITNLQEENERLNNGIKELDNMFYEKFRINQNGSYTITNVDCNDINNKIKELKEGKSDE